MNQTELEQWLWRVSHHHQVTALHRSICLELLRTALFVGPSVFIQHDELRQAARIGNRTTYFRTIRELARWGLIAYSTQRRSGLRCQNRITLLPTTSTPGAALLTPRL